MDLNLEIKIESNGRHGYIYTTFGKEKLKFYWEFGVDKFIAIINVPTVEEWASKLNYDRNMILSEIAKELCRQKCKDCDYEISLNSINIIKK